MHPRGIVKLPRARIGLVVDPRRHLPELLKALEQSLLGTIRARSKSLFSISLHASPPLDYALSWAGGRASDGRDAIDQLILEIRPESTHQRVPLVIGSPEEVSLYERFIAKGHP